jgi:hypothetical protein
MSVSDSTDLPVRIRNDLAARSMRYALSSVSPFGSTSKSILRGLSVVGKRWRACVLASQDLRPPSVTKYMTYCPRCTVYAGPDRKPCRRKYVCPWCWARGYTEVLYKQLSAIMFPENPPLNDYGEPEDNHYSLFEVHTRFRFDMLATPLKLVLATMYHSRRTILDAVLSRRRRLGAWVIQTLEGEVVKKEAYPSMWLVHQRVLILTDWIATPRIIEPQKWDAANTDRVVLPHVMPSKKDLVAIVGRVTSYPAFLLDPRCTDATREILLKLHRATIADDALGGRKKTARLTSQRYGVLRVRRAR